MADTRPDVVVPGNSWINLYLSAGIPVGTALDVYNKGSNNVLIAIAAVQPAIGVGVPLYGGAIGSYLAVDVGETGLWAYSDRGTRILVQEAS